MAINLLSYLEGDYYLTLAKFSQILWVLVNGQSHKVSVCMTCNYYARRLVQAIVLVE